jgi:ABC-type multidrug transport system fused ATPase/permease subunit
VRETFESARPPSAREALRVLARALRWVGPFRARFAVKAGLTLVSLVPPLLLPWPIKAQIDHVALGHPVDPAAWPALLRPLVEPLAGASPTEILLVTLAVQLLLVIAIGAMGSTATERDQADAHLSAGRDTATTTENDLNYGHSRSSGLLGWFEFRWTLRLTQDLNHHYRSRLFERIHALPITAFDDERIGDAIYRLMVDAPALTQAVYRLLLVPLYAPVGILLVTLVLDATFGGTRIDEAALAFLPLGFLATLPFASRIRRRGEASRRAGATTASTLEEGLSNVLAVQSLGGHARERARFDRDSARSFAEYRGLVGVWILAIFAAVAVGAPLVLWLAREGTDLAIEGRLTTGDFALLVTYFAQVAGYAGSLGTLWMRVQSNAAGLERVFFLMDLPGEDDPPGARELAPLAREVRLEGVEFAYEDGSVALRGVDAALRVGEVTAIVGPAGAGKTTLAWLLPRFLRPTRGRVLFDGEDVAGASLASLRRQVAFVFQETQLFDASVEENLRIGRPDATDAELERAAAIAGADGFIRALPDGWRTRLGRAGGTLSVGQKQRLAIARALVRDAPILILDEPTSALDPEKERQLVASLRAAARSRLVLVIAHRLSTVRAAQQILFLDAGRVVERGTHAELMARPGGAYRRFVELQTRGAA